MITHKRFRTFDFWDGAAFGATVSTIIGLATAWYLSGKTIEVAGVVATAAAIPVALLATFGAIWLTRYQIAYARAQDLASAKVVLPLALTQMMEVASNAILLTAGRHTSPPADLEGARRLLVLDNTVLQTLRDNVRSADPLTREWLSVTIARYQVYFARIEGWWASPNPAENRQAQTEFGLSREDALLDWATFSALVEHHYDYARGSCEHVSARLDASRIRSAFFREIFEVNFTRDFEARVATRIARYSDGQIEHFKFSIR